MNRRGFLAGILASGVAPWVVTKAGVLMPVKKIVTPTFTRATIAYQFDAEGRLKMFGPGVPRFEWKWE